ncbi:MAG: hypothetical protein WCG42_05665 [Parachlamydiaceae bacterium]
MTSPGLTRFPSQYFFSPSSVALDNVLPEALVELPHKNQPEALWDELREECQRLGKYLQIEIPTKIVAKKIMTPEMLLDCCQWSISRDIYQEHYWAKLVVLSVKTLQIFFSKVDPQLNINSPSVDHVKANQLMKIKDVVAEHLSFFSSEAQTNAFPIPLKIVVDKSGFYWLPSFIDFIERDSNVRNKGKATQNWPSTVLFSLPEHSEESVSITQLEKQENLNQVVMEELKRVSQPLEEYIFLEVDQLSRMKSSELISIATLIESLESHSPNDPSYYWTSRVSSSLITIFHLFSELQDSVKDLLRNTNNLFEIFRQNSGNPLWKTLKRRLRELSEFQLPKNNPQPIQIREVKKMFKVTLSFLQWMNSHVVPEFNCQLEIWKIQQKEKLQELENWLKEITLSTTRSLIFKVERCRTFLDQEPLKEITLGEIHFVNEQLSLFEYCQILDASTSDQIIFKSISEEEDFSDSDDYVYEDNPLFSLLTHGKCTIHY